MEVFEICYKVKKMKIIQFLRYFTSVVEDNDNNLSLKRVMALIGFIVFLKICLIASVNNPELVIITLAGMITALLGITAVSNFKYAQIDKDSVKPE